MHPAFVYSVQELQAVAVRDIDVPLSARWLAHALSDTETVDHDQTHGRVNARLSMTGREVVVRGMVTARVFMKCGRCMQDAPIDVQADLSLLLSPALPRANPPRAKAETSDVSTGGSKKAIRAHGSRSRVKADEDLGYAFSPEEADLDTYVGDEVVLDGFMREAILLELPIFPLCSEACPGIGAVLPESAEPQTEPTPVDPRLAPLMRFRKK
ncbi:MAG: DUF177 domain-containing protein [Polyangiaceae bacterium]|nr:DUF177 domain-containing protein [Polyangiaceae bacterium]